jgi:hypothetical protein
MKCIYTSFKDTFFDLITKFFLRFIIFEEKGEQASKCLIYFHCPTVTKKPRKSVG